VARAGAAFVADAARRDRRRGKFLFAVSGGKTPWNDAQLPATDLPWDKIHLFQVDERIGRPVIPTAT